MITRRLFVFFITIDCFYDFNDRDNIISTIFQNDNSLTHLWWEYNTFHDCF